MKFLHFRDVWKAASALKIIFSPFDQILQRHGLTDVKCVLCAEFEEVNHILSRLEMLFARFMWSCVRSLPNAVGTLRALQIFSFIFSDMNTILAELTRVCVLVFVDDILIYSRV